MSRSRQCLSRRRSRAARRQSQRSRHAAGLPLDRELDLCTAPPHRKIRRGGFRLRHDLGADDPQIQESGGSLPPSTGDRILVDTNQRVPSPPGIFVIWDGMGLVAKRVEHVPHSDPPKVIIKSVNPEYQTYEREAEEVKIVGRVIWAAKRL